jgi:hypothetical protein
MIRTTDDGQLPEGNDRQPQEACQHQRHEAEGPVATTDHYNTVRFEITTMPLSVTVKRFLSSSGK